MHEFPSAIRRGHQLTGAPHRGPVIRVNRSTNKAHLVVLSIRAAMGPGEPVRTESFEESLEELGRHTYRSFLSRAWIHRGTEQANESIAEPAPGVSSKYHSSSLTGSHVGT